MTDTEHDTAAQDHEATCLMCAVRALTEGDPAATWTPETTGQTISGVVLRKGELSTDWGRVPFVDLWMGGTGRVRIKAYGAALRHAIEGVAPLIGDRLQVRYDGERVIESGKFAGRQTKAYSANVQRGH